MIDSVTSLLTAIRGGAIPRDLESETLEFKEEERGDARRSLQILADAVVCLANHEGGLIVAGIANAASGSEAIVGVSNRLTVDDIRRGIFDRTRPSLSVPVLEVVDGQRVIAITVPKGATFYANAAGTSTRRVGKDCVPFPPEQQRQASAARGHIDWSAELTVATTDDVSLEEVGRVRRLLRLAGREDLASSDDRKLVRDLRLADQQGRLTRAGVLILASEDTIRQVVPTYGYAYQYRTSPGSESSARFRGYRPVLGAIETLLEAVQVRSLVHPLTASGGVQLQIQDYPAEAIRELVINALVHRDFELNGAVDVEHTPDSLVISSPGGLVFGVTSDNILTHPSTPRHRLLLETVATLQVAERTGQGIDRAYRELLRSGKPPPSISDDGYEVRVLVPGGGGNDTFGRFVADLNPSEGSDVDVLLALSHLRNSRSINATKLASVAQRSPAEAQTVLERIVHVGIIEPSRRSAARAYPTYSLTGRSLAALRRAVRYHVRQVDDTDRKVADHVTEYGHVTNQTLRRLFDLDIAAARDLLRALQQRGVLEKLDQARGGRGVRYVAGPKLRASLASVRGLVAVDPSAPGQLQLPVDAAERGTDT